MLKQAFTEEREAESGEVYRQQNQILFLDNWAVLLKKQLLCWTWDLERIPSAVQNQAMDGITLESRT